MKIHVVVISCDKFRYVCIVEICRKSTEPVFNGLLHFFVATHARAAQKLRQVCGQVEITWIQVRMVGRISLRESASAVCK
jgi:hypothetical protein